MTCNLGITAPRERLNDHLKGVERVVLDQRKDGPGKSRSGFQMRNKKRERGKKLAEGRGEKVGGQQPYTGRTQAGPGKCASNRKSFGSGGGGSEERRSDVLLRKT